MVYKLLKTISSHLKFPNYIGRGDSYTPITSNTSKKVTGKNLSCVSPKYPDFFFSVALLDMDCLFQSYVNTEAMPLRGLDLMEVSYSLE